MQMSPYYVYRHCDPITREAKYVGIGQYDRAWSVRKSQRKDRHFQWLQEQIKAGHTLQDIVEITHSNLTKEKALEIEKELILQNKYEFNELMNPDHWHRGRKYDKELAVFAKNLHTMGYGYLRIAALMGSAVPSSNHMRFKRMLENV